MVEQLYTGGIARVYLAFVYETGARAGQPIDLRLCTQIIVTMTRPGGTVKYTRDATRNQVHFVNGGGDGLAFVDTREGEMERPGDYEWQGWYWDASGGPYPSSIEARDVKKSHPIPANE